MLRQRIINLAEDEILIIKRLNHPEELASVRILTDDTGEPHIFVNERPFGNLQLNVPSAVIPTILYSDTDK